MLLDKDSIEEHTLNNQHQKNNQKYQLQNPIKLINESEISLQWFISLKKRCKKVKRAIE